MLEVWVVLACKLHDDDKLLLLVIGILLEGCSGMEEQERVTLTLLLYFPPKGGKGGSRGGEAGDGIMV